MLTSIKKILKNIYQINVSTTSTQVFKFVMVYSLVHVFNNFSKRTIFTILNFFAFSKVISVFMLNLYLKNQNINNLIISVFSVL